MKWGDEVGEMKWQASRVERSGGLQDMICMSSSSGRLSRVLGLEISDVVIVSIRGKNE